MVEEACEHVGLDGGLFMRISNKMFVRSESKFAQSIQRLYSIDHSVGNAFRLKLVNAIKM